MRGVPETKFVGFAIYKKQGQTLFFSVLFFLLYFFTNLIKQIIHKEHLSLNKVIRKKYINPWILLCFCRQVTL